MKKLPDEKDPRENLSSQRAAKKIRELALAARVCLFGTQSGKSLSVRPMSVQDVDANGDLWFLSGVSSAKNRQILRNPRVQLIFANVGKAQYLNLHGIATISRDKELLKKHWTPIAKTWFHEGVSDPEATVIRVRTESGYYWDTEHGKAVSMLSVALGALTGKTLDDSVEGSVRPALKQKRKPSPVGRRKRSTSSRR